jgi:hypothetical protein
MIVTGHHWEFTYAPKGYTKPEHRKAVGWAFRLMDSMFVNPGSYVSEYSNGKTERIGDIQIHAEQWQEVMKWDFKYACGHHDVEGVCGPIDNDEIMQGEGGVKGHMKRVLEASGELNGTVDPGSWYPYRPSNAMYKTVQNEAKFIKKYGEPPVLRFGGPNYTAEGLPKE